MLNTTAKFSLLPFLTAFILTFLLYGPSEAKLVDKVVAVVNGEVITNIELEQALQGIKARLRQNTPPAEMEKALAKARETTLDGMIENLLIAQKAKELKVEVTSEEITGAIENIAAENGLTVDQLYDELKKNNVKEDEYRRKMANQISRSKLLNYEVRSKIVISEEKARHYYDTVYTKQQMADGYHIMQIGFTWDSPESSSTTREGARLRAESIRKMVAEGQDFRELAQSFSDLPSSKEGGDLGFFKEDEMADQMRKIIINLQPGQISDIIETQGSFQFFLMLARNIGGKAEFAPFELVSSKIQNELGQKELNKNYQNWMKELLDQALIKKLP
jgi:peptidyl-prolyl cis-trans isomerase SurA